MNEVVTDSKSKIMIQSTADVATQTPIGEQGEKLFPPDEFGIPLPSRAYVDREFRCRHEWRIIENFHTEFPRDQSEPRRYAAYCVYCLTSKGVELKINK